MAGKGKARDSHPRTRAQGAGGHQAASAPPGARAPQVPGERVRHMGPNPSGDGCAGHETRRDQRPEGPMEQSGGSPAPKQGSGCGLEARALNEDGVLFRNLRVRPGTQRC